MKIDTQGMSGPADPNYKGKPLDEQQRDLPKATIRPTRLFTESYVKEMKILINEVLDEREYQRKLRMAYDNPTPPGISYFDTKHFEYKVGEQEPSYPLKEMNAHKWENNQWVPCHSSPLTLDELQE